jgi:hypothetical protein
MSWLNSFFAAVLTAVVTAAATGLAAAGYVSWYRVSSREGESAYFVAYIVVLGAFVGFFAGLVLSRYFGGAGASGFFRGLGISSGAMVGLAGVVALIAWVLADIPPTINGHELDLVVEVRLPRGAEQPPVIEGKQFILFESGSIGAPSRVRESGVLDVAKATPVDGRWVVPGSVRIITTRGTRFLTVVLDDKRAFGFELSFPGHPGPRYRQWSGWLPDAVADHWPDSRMSYRFRVQERIPVETPAPGDPFAALTADSPLDEWLRFYDAYGRIPERRDAILKQVQARPADLAKLVRSPNDEEFARAMVVIEELKTIDPQVAEAVRGAGDDIEGEIRKFNAMEPQQSGYDDLGNRIQMRFNRWGHACYSFQVATGVDGRPQVEEILKLASQKQSPKMRSVIDDAQVVLGYLAQAPRKPN